MLLDGALLSYWPHATSLSCVPPFPTQLVATACLFLATKVDNCPRSISDVVRCCLKYKCSASKKPEIRRLVGDQVRWHNNPS